MLINTWLNVLLLTEPMHDNGTQTIKAEVVEPIPEPQEMCREEANTSSTHSPSPRTVYTFSDGKVSVCVCEREKERKRKRHLLWHPFGSDHMFTTVLALGLCSFLFKLFSFL